MSRRRVLLASAFLALIIASVYYASYNTELLDWLVDITAKHDIPILDDSGATASTVKATVDAGNRFALDLYGRYSSGDGNILFSPYSISTALSMVYEGARGRTADEMQATLHFLENDGERRPSVARIFNVLNGRDREYTLHAVNALWIQEGFPVLDEYTDTITNYYGGEATNLDFMGELEESRITINNWVEERTNDKIRDFFPQGSLDALTRLVLTNAIYFKGDWVTEFDEKKTEEEDFHVGPTESIEVDMMRLIDVRFNYTETDEIQVLELPYKGEDISMIILLPRDNDLRAVEERLSLERYYDLIDGMEKTKIDVYLPRFRFETKYLMNEDLKEMGIPHAFNRSADFTGMLEEDLLYIDKVIHQAFIEVNEEGTEAAAATGVSIALESAPIRKIFRADHPFILTIQDKVTNVILFMGRVMDPR